MVSDAVRHDSNFNPGERDVSKLIKTARLCHEVNRAICEAHGDHSQVAWEEAASWQRESAVRGVQYLLGNPLATPADQHDAWVRDKIIDGWQVGPVKDVAAKLHPCLVPYDELPPAQRLKDYTFQAIVRTRHRLPLVYPASS